MASTTTTTSQSGIALASRRYIWTAGLLFWMTFMELSDFLRGAKRRIAVRGFANLKVDDKTTSQSKPCIGDDNELVPSNGTLAQRCKPLVEDTNGLALETETSERVAYKLRLSNKSTILLPLDHYVDKKTNNLNKEAAEDLLDFSILGFAKTGTTFLTDRWLPSDYRICMAQQELRTWKQENGQVATATALHELTNNEGGSCFLRGYKSPAQVLNRKALQMLSQWWPKAKLIVGVRHPVLWFESFYNFRQKIWGILKTGPEQLRAGNCEKDVCTDHANFHIFLSYFGKTSLRSKEEFALLRPESRNDNGTTWNRSRVINMTNPIFIYETSQLDAVHNGDVFKTMRLDLSDFLGLDAPLPTKLEASKEKHSYNKTIDICDDRYQGLRNELVEIGSRASTWILQYFVASPDVTVSSPFHFQKALMGWKSDPCHRRRRNRRI